MPLKNNFALVGLLFVLFIGIGCDYTPVEPTSSDEDQTDETQVIKPVPEVQDSFDVYVTPFQVDKETYIFSNSQIAHIIITDKKLQYVSDTCSIEVDCAYEANLIGKGIKEGEQIDFERDGTAYRFNMATLTVGLRPPNQN